MEDGDVGYGGYYSEEGKVMVEKERRGSSLYYFLWYKSYLERKFVVNLYFLLKFLMQL